MEQNTNPKTEVEQSRPTITRRKLLGALGVAGAAMATGGLLSFPKIASAGTVDFFNVKDYGAKGDGVANDTAAIRAAINAAGVNGGVVFFPVGKFLISSTLVINKPGVSLRGSSPGASVIQTNAASGDIITIGASPAFVYAEVRDLQITAVVARTSGYAIAVNGCEDYNLENLILFRSSSLATGHGLHFSEMSGLGYIRAIDIEIVGAFRGIVIDGGNDRYFNQLWLRGNLTAGSTGILLSNTGGDWFTDVEVVQFECGVNLSPATGSAVGWVKFHNVLADTNTLHGWLFDGAGSTWGIAMDSCWAGTTGVANINARGMLITNVDGLMAAGMRIVNSGGHGIEIGTNPKSLNFKGGFIAGSSYAAAGNAHGIATALNYTGGLLVDGMKIGQTAGEMNTQGYGVFINGGNDNYTLIGNDVTGNVTGGINDRANGVNKIIRANRGYKTENGGQFSFNGTGSQKVFTIAHGLAHVPDYYHVTAASAGAATAFYVSADATNITVTYTTAPAAGENNVVLEWSAHIK
ncbi:glycosyl hydrolase family 28-related protein [Paenibacillus sp. GCM10027626]|uniref:glycosyl hydrolase family 28-related protein n=1 Tax=Paenibacillus sp. GCM10027626 TaxID=3273411 RepID=UPI003629A0F3